MKLSRSDIWYYQCPTHNIPFYGSSYGFLLNQLVQHLTAEHGMKLEEAIEDGKKRLGASGYER